MSTEDALPEGLVSELPSKWNALCSSKQTSIFAWAHNGINAGRAWVHILPKGQLKTKWGNGKWEKEKKDNCLHLIFGSTRHVCMLRGDGKFEVTERLKEKTGQKTAHPTVKGAQVFSAGWPISERPQQAAQVLPSKREASDSTGASDDPLSESPPTKRARKEQVVVNDPLEGFNVFLILAQAQASKDRKAVRPREVMTRIKRCWEGLSEEQQRDRKQEYKTIEAQYKQAMKLQNVRKVDQEPVDGHAVPGAEDGNQVDVDDVLPKKPVGGAFGVFGQEKRKDLMEAASSSQEKSVAVIQKKIKVLWDALDDSQKQPYQEQYATRKKVYDDAVEARKKVMEQRKRTSIGGS